MKTPGGCVHLHLALDDLLLRNQQIHAIKQPTRRNQNSLYNLIHNTGSLVTSEAGWILYQDDLAALANDKEDGWFNGFLEDTLKQISRAATTVGPTWRPL